MNQNVSLFLEKRDSLSRHSSFDFCFNYFQGFFEFKRTNDLANQIHLECSCLQLGFYLASWGMFRGKSALARRSFRVYEPVIKTIATFDDRIWLVDVDSYTDENISYLIDCASQLREPFLHLFEPSDTLITKMMLGVFGNIPALDTFVCKGLGVNSLNAKSLKRIRVFYDTYRSIIDQRQKEIKTFSSKTGILTNRIYTKAKIIDMAAFIEGQNMH